MYILLSLVTRPFHQQWQWIFRGHTRPTFLPIWLNSLKRIDPHPLAIHFIVRSDKTHSLILALGNTERVPSFHLRNYLEPKPLNQIYDSKSEKRDLKAFQQLLCNIYLKNDMLQSKQVIEEKLTHFRSGFLCNVAFRDNNACLAKNKCVAF